MPILPQIYVAAGFILMPYCELREPFVIWYDATGNQSRTDFYGGEMKSFQNESGLYQVVWSPNRQTHVPEETCYISDSSPTQGVFPDLANFQFVRFESCDAESTTLVAPYLRKMKVCKRFEEIVIAFNRTSKYVIWTHR